jgi:hypothetical protein
MLKKKAERCAECEVPLFISRELNWEGNGVISLRRSPRNRMVLIEANIIDNLFKGIEELIGMSIEHIVIESRRRDVRKYIEGSFPAWMRRTVMFINESLGDKVAVRHVIKPIREKLGKSLNSQVFDIGRLYGYGGFELGPLWGGRDIYPWRVNIMHNPHSVLFSAAEALASVETFEGRDHWVRYRELESDVYEIAAYPQQHPLKLKERLKRKRYDFKPGDIEYERCGGCGLPKEIARLRWDLEAGVIYDLESGWRMTLLGPFALEAVLKDLESELGSSIPEVVVEAQRRYVKSRITGGEWRRSGTTFNRMTGFRGLGNIAEFEVDEKHLGITIHNSSLPLLVLGMAQAVYETALSIEKTTYEWELKDDGDFVFTIIM